MSTPALNLESAVELAVEIEDRQSAFTDIDVEIRLSTSVATERARSGSADSRIRDDSRSTTTRSTRPEHA